MIIENQSYQIKSISNFDYLINLKDLYKSNNVFRECILKTARAEIVLFLNRRSAYQLIQKKLNTFPNIDAYYHLKEEKYGIDNLTFIYPMPSYSKLSIQQEKLWMSHIKECETKYINFLEKGMPINIIKKSLPDDIKTSLIINMNYEKWIDFFHKNIIEEEWKNDYDILELLIPLLIEFGTKHPVIFDDLIVSLKLKNERKKKITNVDIIKETSRNNPAL